MSAAKELPALSDVQLEIMNFVWDHDGCTVGDVWKELHARRGVARNTVHTLITRLDEKGWLTHRADSAGFRYSATVSREVTQKEYAQKLVETVFRGSAEGLVLTLLSGGTLSAQEADRIAQRIRKASKGAT